MRGRRIRGIRPEEKESSLLTQHCISFFCYHKGELSFFGGRGGGNGILFGGMNFRVLSQIMKEGNFASSTSIAAGVWFSYSDHVEYSRGHIY